MKTQIIKLDIHDDVTSVRDKMSWGKAERILLVFPPRSRILHRSLDLLLLQRHAATLGADLAIVSGDPDQRRSAEELSIPSFVRIESAKRKSWERVKAPQKLVRREERPDLDQLRRDAFPPEAAWRSNFWLRFGFFTLAVLAILAVLSLFIPSATIHLKPATGLQNQIITVNASREVTSVNLAGNLPARLNSLIVEHSKTVKATGTVAVPDAKAGGLATFRNLTTAQVSIPVGTVILTQSSPSVRFATTTDVVVPAGIDKTLDVPIQAVEAGTTGNLPAETLVSFEGELGTSLAVTNSSPTTGGTDKSAPIQTAADRSNLRAVLMSDILEQCGTNFQSTFTQGDIFFPDTLDVSQVISETYFPAEDQSADTLSLTMRVQCQTQYAARTDLDALSKMVLDASLPEGYFPSSGELMELPTSVPVTEAGGFTRWEMQVQRLVQARLDPMKVMEISAGRKPADAVQQIKRSLALAESPVIQVTPPWWPWLPLVQLRITVSIGN
jgi:Baseplate J-like protein.